MNKGVLRIPDVKNGMSKVTVSGRVRPNITK